MQRERLKHLMANAILELWKKETGSLSPVIIEGTICITSGSGKTIVVQVRVCTLHIAYRGCLACGMHYWRIHFKKHALLLKF